MAAIRRVSAAPLTPIEPQTFANESDRERLSCVALRAFLSLSKEWKLTNAEAAKLIGVSDSSFDRIKNGKCPTLNQDQMTRISAMVGIYKGLHLLFADNTANDWMRRTNIGPLFGKQTPVAAMIEGGIPRMLEIRCYIDAVRGGL